MVSRVDAVESLVPAAVSLAPSASSSSNLTIIALLMPATLSHNQCYHPGPAGADIESAAYLGTYDPTNLCQNYLGDSGIVGLGTTVGSATYSFTVPARAHFVVVVNTTGTVTTSSQFSGTVSGFVDDTPGPGPCPAR
jgi:hypothetical protein